MTHIDHPHSELGRGLMLFAVSATVLGWLVFGTWLVAMQLMEVVRG